MSLSERGKQWLAEQQATERNHQVVTALTTSDSDISLSPEPDEPPDREDHDGARLLDDIQTFLARFVAYPNDSAAVAHTLWIAHAHLANTAGKAAHAAVHPRAAGCSSRYLCGSRSQ